MVNVLVCIPVHGYSLVLGETLSSIRSSMLDEDIAISVLLSNSGGVFEVEAEMPVRVVQIPSDSYWGGNVRFIYEYVSGMLFDYLVLMNHDCLLHRNCLNELISFAAHNQNCVAHAVLLFRDDPDVVWWAGSRSRCFRSSEWVYAGLGVNDVPMAPYEVDSMMGQCMIIPKAATKPEFLHASVLPHYYADSLQSIEMKACSFRLYVLPSAKAYTDQSDLVAKRNRIYPYSFQRLIQSFVAPYSPRNLVSVYYSVFRQQNCLLGRLIFPLVVVVGRIVKSVYQFLYYNFTGRSYW